MLGKIDKHGNLVPAPKVLKHDGRVHHNPKDHVYKEAGFFPIIEEPKPVGDGKHYKEHYVQNEDSISLTWVEDVDYVEKPVEVIPTIEERVSTLEALVAQLYAEKETVDEPAEKEHPPKKP